MSSTVTRPVTVSVKAAPADWNWPTGYLAVLTKKGGDPDAALASGRQRWISVLSVTREKAAYALSLTDAVCEDMTPVAMATAILTAFETGGQEVDFACLCAQHAARAITDRAAGTRPTREERRTYRRYWPDTARTALCWRLADRLLTATLGSEPAVSGEVA
jgi:hypothetical protein